MGIFVCAGLLFPASLEAGEDLKDLQSDFRDLTNKEREIRDKLAELAKEKISLSDQIIYIDTSIELTQIEVNKLQYQINEKEGELATLNGDIDTLSSRINRLGESLDYQTEIYKNRATASYKASRVTPLELFLTANSPSELISYTVYLKRFEAQDRNLLEEMKELTSIYKEQKDILQVKKDTVEEVKQEIEANKLNMVGKKYTLQGQKDAKRDLLEITKSDEAIYQRQLEAILAEQQAIENVIARFTTSLFNDGVPEGTEISRGEIVGIQGSTGNSTGDHVHFGVYIRCGEDDKNWCHTDPRPYVESGELGWPLEDFEISQEYGETEFARNSGFYPNHFHNGIDMYGDIGSLVLAPSDGTLIYASDSVGGKGAVVYRNEELMSIMWHIR